MMDEAYEWTENQIKALERRLNREYSQAVKEVQETLDDYLARFEKKDNTWSEWVEKAKADPAEYKKRQAEYKKWRTGQLAVGRRWKAMKDRLADDLHKTNVTAREIVKGKMPDIYAENHNYGTYEVEKGARLDTSYTLYDRSTMEVLMRDNPQLLPEPGRATSQRIYNKLDVRWNRQQLQSVMMQGLLQGDSIPKLATRLANEVGDKNRKAAIRNARTMATGAQNAGRIDSYKRAKDMGISMKQEWLSTLDGRTRHSHRMVDHEVQEVGHEFSNGCKYPGDPDAPPAEVYNCRCSVRALVDGLQPMARNFRDLSQIEAESYEEWKQSKKSHSNPIDLPEKKGEAIRQEYIAEYEEMQFDVRKYDILRMPDEEAGLLNEYVNNLTGNEKKKWVEAFRNTDYRYDNNEIPHYKSGTNIVVLNDDSSALTVIHETGHRIDEGALKKQMHVKRTYYEDDIEVTSASKYVQELREGTIISDIKNICETLEVPYDEEKESWGCRDSELFSAFLKWGNKVAPYDGKNEKAFACVSDIIDGMTNGKVGGIFCSGGHAEDYWNSTVKYDEAFLANQEAWAQFCALKVSKNEEMLDLLEKTVPGMYKALLTAYTEVFG